MNIFHVLFCVTLHDVSRSDVLFHFAMRLSAPALGSAGRPGHPRGREHRGVVAQAAVPVEDAEQKERPVAVLLITSFSDQFFGGEKM